MILERNIVLKREGSKFLFPTRQRKEVEVPANPPARDFIMCRTVSFDQESGILDVKLFPDFVGNPQYQISIEVNSEVLSPLHITKVNFVTLNPAFAPTDRPPHAGSFHKSKPYQKTVLKSDPVPEMPKPREIINLEIELPVKELAFSDGKVSFEYYVSRFSRKIAFDIPNDFLKKEFDSVKNYFPKVLNIDKFSITIELDFQDGKILNTICKSSHVSLIDSSIFELVEDLYISDHIIDGSRDEVVSLDKIALEASKSIGSENLENTEWLLNKLLVPNRTKHYYHLRYLSDKHSANTFNLHLTGNPLSFIFLLKIPSGFCLVWETYSTHEATYVWKLDDMPATQLGSSIQEHIERIKWLRDNNKMTYLRTKPANFLKIEHDYSGEDLGFKKWKSQLEGFILASDGG